MCSAKAGKEKKSKTAIGVGKEWKKQWTAKATLP